MCRGVPARRGDKTYLCMVQVRESSRSPVFESTETDERKATLVDNQRLGEGWNTGKQYLAMA